MLYNIAKAYNLARVHLLIKNFIMWSAYAKEGNMDREIQDPKDTRPGPATGPLAPSNRQPFPPPAGPRPPQGPGVNRERGQARPRPSSPQGQSTNHIPQNTQARPKPAPGNKTSQPRLQTRPQGPRPQVAYPLAPESKGVNPWMIVSIVLIVLALVGAFFAYRLITRQTDNYKKLETEASNLRLAQEKLNEEYQSAESERLALTDEVAKLEKQIEDLEQKQTANPSSLKVNNVEVKVPEEWLLVPGEGKGNYYLYGSKKPGDVSQGYIYTATYPLGESIDLTNAEVVTQNFESLLAGLTQDGTLELYDYYESQVQNLPARIYSGNMVSGDQKIPLKLMLVLEPDTVVTISATDQTAQDSEILLDSIIPHTKGEVQSLS